MVNQEGRKDLALSEPDSQYAVQTAVEQLRVHRVEIEASVAAAEHLPSVAAVKTMISSQPGSVVDGKAEMAHSFPVRWDRLNFEDQQLP